MQTVSIGLIIAAWALAGYGITQIITDSSIFRPIRKLLRNTVLSELVTCFLCSSVWVMGGLSAFLYSPSAEIFQFNNYHIAVYIFTDAMMGSAILWFMRLIENATN
jgi:hypothetical protein